MTDNRFAFIGLDAQLDGMLSLDHLQAACYKGENILSSDFKVDRDFSALCKTSVAKVIEANLLKPSQVAVIAVENSDRDIDGAQAFYSYQRVTNLGEALSACSIIIQQTDIAVLIVAANVQSSLPKPQQTTISFADNFCEYSSRNGVCSLLLASEQFAAVHQSTVYGYLKNYESAENNPQSMASAIERSFINAKIRSEMISAVEVSALADPQQSLLETDVLLKSYKNGLTVNSALSCVKSVTGENGPLSELLGLLNLIFALQLRYRCAVKGWNGPVQKQLEKWRLSPFYIFNQAAPVFPNKDKTARVGSYSCLSENSYTHLIVEENSDDQLHNNGFIRSLDLKLFIVAEDSEQALLAKLTDLLKDKPFAGLAERLYQCFLKEKKKNYCLVLIAESLSELEDEIKKALVGIKQAFAHNSDWKTPKGSYFTTFKKTEKDNIAFLYPGIGATYIGLGRELFHLFPDLYPKIIPLAEDLADTLKDRRLNPRSIASFDFKALKKQELALRQNLADIAESGVGFACVFTQLFESVFNIKADLAAGYSMGEVSMFAALGCWQSPGLMSTRLANSNTFNKRLSGELQTIRELWNLPETEKLIWETYSIKATPVQVEAVLKTEDRVYITIINSPDSLVIAGYPEDCLAVIKRLSVRGMPLNIANAIHCAPAYAEYEKMQRLYEMDLNPRIATKLYSSSCYLPIPQHKKAIALSISKCLCQQVDFPRLINSLSAQGGRIFIEMGAGSSLSSWTDKILKAQQKTEPHLCVAINAKGSDELLSYFRATAKLLSAGVDMNLQRFFQGSIVQPVDKK